MKHLLAFLFTSLIFPALLPAQNPDAAPGSTQIPPQLPQPSATDQEQFISYWTTETGWHSELELRNNVSGGTDLIVTPVLRAADGTETALSPVTVKPNEVRTVDITASVMGLAPQLTATYGSMVLRYHSHHLQNLFAMVMVNNVGHSIAYHFDGYGEDIDPHPGSREGIWWLPNDTASDYLILTNQGSRTLQTELSLYDSAGKETKQKIALSARSTVRFSVRQLVRAAGLTGPFGGIKVFAPSHSGSLDTLHILFDEEAAFSALMKMFDHSPNSSIDERDYAASKVWTLRAPMLALSNPDPALAFPAKTVLKPKVFVRNTLPRPVNISLRFNWRALDTSGKTAASAIRLNPYETRAIDVGALQATNVIPKNANWASVVLTTDGKPDEVVAVAASYDESLRYGAQTPFSDQLAFQWEGSIWQYDSQHNSLITAGNGGSKPLQAAFTVYYNRGSQKYQLEQTLQPDEQMWIDMGKLIREHIPDKDGNVLPPDLTSGSYEFRDLTNRFIGNLFEGKVVFDKTYGHVTYGCGACCGYTQAAFWYSPLGIPFQGTAPNGVNGYTSCSQSWDNVSGAFYNSWTTVNHSVTTANQYGTHTGVAVGSTTSNTRGQLEHASTRECQLLYFTPSGSDNVLKLDLQGNPHNSIFVGNDANLSPANSIFATVSPANGTFTQGSSVASDTFTNVTAGGPGWVVKTTTQSTNSGDRTLTVTYAVSGQGQRI